MSKRSPKSVEEKLEIVQRLLNHEKSVSQLSKLYGVSESAINSWKMKYEKDGVVGLKESRTWNSYSKEVKEQAVLDYLYRKGSLTDICQKYDISAHSVLEKWIKATSKGYSRMKQGRQTTFEERVEIVNYTIAHGKDYQAAIEKFGVSYQQVYSQVRKFEKDGSQGLLDRRGKALESKPNLTEAEQLQLKIKQLEERNRLLEIEVDLLKKLEEVKRRNRR